MAVTRSRAEFVEEIRSAYAGTVEGIIRAGKLILQARESMDHGAFAAMCREELPFSRQTAYKLMSIAQDHRFVAHVRQLPPAWGTLYELTKVDDDEFYQAAQDGTIRPEMRRTDVRGLIDGWKSRRGLSERVAGVLLTVKGWDKADVQRLVDELQEVL
jgi:hypothetical protein